MKNDILTYSLDGTGLVLSAIQTNEIMQFISFSISILACLVSIAFTIYKWYNKAMEDGKIDNKEVDELLDELHKESKKAKKKK